MLRAQLDTMVPPEEVELLQSRLDEQEALVSQVLEEAAESQQVGSSPSATQSLCRPARSPRLSL